ncbi:hypothetical protein [Pedobacter sp. SYP-B3415]|uniref:hypothetical protein n=1 Tax=Pedobacter sp. SYP-B3415 TaxID=2496641 RepID=UPI00101CF8D4|nr:hypothetical protein [Pedobacter sp. SYP-B3415]
MNEILLKIEQGSRSQVSLKFQLEAHYLNEDWIAENVNSPLLEKQVLEALNENEEFWHNKLNLHHLSGIVKGVRLDMEEIVAYKTPVNILYAEIEFSFLFDVGYPGPVRRWDATYPGSVVLAIRVQNKRLISEGIKSIFIKIDT